MSTLLFFPAEVSALKYRTEHQRAEPFRPLFDRYPWLWCISWSESTVELNGFQQDKIKSMVNWEHDAPRAFAEALEAVNEIRQYTPACDSPTVWRDGSWQYKMKGPYRP